jgi:hypothetical protein
MEWHSDNEDRRSEPKTRAFLHVPKNPALKPRPLSGGAPSRTPGRPAEGTAQIPAFLCSKGFWAILLALMAVFSDLRLGQGSQRSDGQENAISHFFCRVFD